MTSIKSLDKRMLKGASLKYVAKDGSEFTDAAQFIDHEKNLEFSFSLKEMIYSSLQIPMDVGVHDVALSVNNVIEFMRANKEVVHAVLATIQPPKIRVSRKDKEAQAAAEAAEKAAAEAEAEALKQAEAQTQAIDPDSQHQEPAYDYENEEHEEGQSYPAPAP